MVDLDFSRSATLRVSAGTGAANVYLIAGAGAHRLEVGVTVGSHGLPEAVPIQLSGGLYAAFSDATRWIGPLEPTYIVTRSIDCQERLTCSVSDQQLRVIEDIRAGRDLQLRLDLAGLLVYPVDRLYPLKEAQESLYVPAQAWQRQLESMGAAVVVEVLLPMPLDGSVRRRAAERIREAKSLITDGKYEEAVVKARLALDPVREVTRPHVPPSNIKAQDRTQLQRWSVVVESLYSLTSGAGHDDAVTEDFTWSRADAVAVLSAVAGLLRRVAD